MGVSEIVKCDWSDVASPLSYNLIYPIICKINHLLRGNKYRNFTIAPIWFLSNAGFVESKLMILTERLCISGFSSTQLLSGGSGGREKTVSCKCDRGHWLLSGEKNRFGGHLQPVQKLPESPGLALPSSPPAPRGLQDELTHSRLSTHPGLALPPLISQSPRVSAPGKGWISLFNKNSFPRVFPEEINYFVAKKDLCHILKK